jgi:hypothetical protein
MDQLGQQEDNVGTARRVLAGAGIQTAGLGIWWCMQQVIVIQHRRI